MALVQQGGAENLLSLLGEEDQALRHYALDSLNNVVHDFWFQISSSLATVEAFYEDDEFKHRELAALVASKVFYHLGELEDALTYALGAGSLFDISEKSDYVQALLAKCLDKYTELRMHPDNDAKPDGRMTAIVERMFDRCHQDGQYEQAVGLALDVRRLDKLEQSITGSSDQAATLSYALQACQQTVVNRAFRQEVLRLLVRLGRQADVLDWVTICQCLMFLDNAEELAKILHTLLTGSEEDVLLAYQVGFDLYENEMQSFLQQVYQRLDFAPKPPQSAIPTSNGDTPEQGAQQQDAQPTSAPPGASEPAGGASAEAAPGEEAAATAAAPAVAETAEDQSMEVDDAAADANGNAAPGVPEEEVQYVQREKRLRNIISGRTPILLYLEFLHSHNHADLVLLKNAKAAVEARNSVCHSALVFANAIMHSGTTADTFLRNNLDWLSRATNWAKFGATAGLGVIHRGHLTQATSLMAPYLPPRSSNSPFSEGGGLYALGLIHANHGEPIIPFLLESLRNSSHEVVQHGACLGLGIAGLGSNNSEIFEEIKGVLFTDGAISGEAAGLALGLLSCGSGTDKAEELLAYAHDTQHEKIIRGVAMGLAFIMYGREEAADVLIESMTRDQDPIIRYGGVYAIGMAYRGTANNAAIQKLLHFAVGDVSDDVRRAAVLVLGFVLMNVPEQCPRIVSLLAESYNPHVRYGAAMAVGISCAGTGRRDAQLLIEPLLTDAVDFVRQGAFVATALVMLQQPESQVASLRKLIAKVTADKHEEVLCRMGAIMAGGILDAGGRNMTVGLRSASGYFRRTSVVALAVFTHHWYWFALSYFLSLALKPSVLIGLSPRMVLPKMQVKSNCKPSQFAYPPPVTEEASVAVLKVPTAVLSTTARAKERAKKREDLKARASGVDSEATPRAADAGKAGASASGMQVDEAEPSSSSKAEGAKAEPSSYMLANPARVTSAQERYISFNADERWRPLRSNPPHSGILMCVDTRPDEPMEAGEMRDSQAPVAEGAVPAAVPQPSPARSTEPDTLPPPAPFGMNPAQGSEARALPL